MAKEKNWVVGLIVVGVIILLILLWYISTYNSLVKQNEAVDGQWAQVETQYQRRVDLIPNLVNTVSGYADFEKSTLVQITQLRSQWQTSQNINDKIETANQIESTLSKLLVVMENYPDLKANTNFLALQDELANTENKIAVERGRYNIVVRDFNARIKMFPSNIIANNLGYTSRNYFNSAIGSDATPIVDFSNK
jgi:LemA protein